ncbi:Succinyl-CoA ligase [ADP-forming] beta chain [hydrothermal vent metagenome]|uniref:Succinyl-CoA ligase [ADP-forming] beta chain n=1 Tax=hydrothermal vent metagenome TaxID=652676 RepID=A0A3B0Z2V2_9ZZZZ
MNLHEFQAKKLFADYGMPVPNHTVIKNLSELDTALNDVDASKWVIKAQVHAGGRGKAGGVKIIDNKADAKKYVESMLGTQLVTFQTDDKGQPVNQMLIEQPCDIARELYLGAVVDRSLRKIVFMASTEGGTEIEKVAAETPEKIIKAAIDPLTGLQPFQCRQLAFGLGLEGEQIKQFSKLLTGLAKLFEEKDLSLVEVNPLVVTQQGNMLCLDGKINVDDNALYRHKDLQAMHDASQEDDRENKAKEWELNYIALEGQIGCMVNGAGLAMATMDLIKLSGGDPANFLDVGGTATKERVAEAFKIITSDSNVKGILVNIFGGIVRCDLIAEGIIGAVQEVGLKVPVVVRLEGNQATKGLELLSASDVKVVAASGLQQAAETIVKLVGEAT